MPQLVIAVLGRSYKRRPHLCKDPRLWRFDFLGRLFPYPEPRAHGKLPCYSLAIEGCFCSHCHGGGSLSADPALCRGLTSNCQPCMILGLCLMSPQGQWNPGPVGVRAYSWVSCHHQAAKGPPCALTALALSSLFPMSGCSFFFLLSSSEF